MLSYISLFFKGMLFGIANLIPGVSGGTIAVVTGVYEKLIDSINNLIKKFKSSIIFLLIYGIGAALAILALSKGMKWALKYFELPISLLFIGLIVGSMGAITKPVKNKMKWYHYIIVLLTFAFVVGLLYIPFPEATVGNLKFYDYLLLVLCGFLASIAMVVPGISGMMMFYIFGHYETIMGALSGLTSFSTMGSSILVLLPVGIGVLIGIFSAAKGISILLKKFPISTYSAIIGFVIGSIFALMYEGGIIDQLDLLIKSPSLNYYFTIEAAVIGDRIIYTWGMVTIGILLFLTGLMGSLLLVTMSRRKELEDEETNKLVELKREEMKQQLLKEIEEMNNKNKKDLEDD